MNGLTLLFALVTLAAVGTFRVETAAPVSEIVKKASVERHTRQQCLNLSAITLNSDFSSVPKQCKEALLKTTPF